MKNLEHRLVEASTSFYEQRVRHQDNELKGRRQGRMSNRTSTVIDLLFLEAMALISASYFFRGATSECDGFMHLSKIQILLDNLRAYGYFPRWNPYWYFGVPMWRLYSPLSYYIMAFLGWVFHLSIVDIVMTWTYLVFSLITLSTYFLAKEIGLKRF